MRTVLFTMSLAGTLALFCCVLVFRLFGRGLKAKWRRGLLILTLAFYVIPIPYCKFILLHVGWMLNITPGAGVVSSGMAFPVVSRYEILIDQAGRRFYSDAQARWLVIDCLFLAAAAAVLLYQLIRCLRAGKAVRRWGRPAGAGETALLEELKTSMGIRRTIGLVRSERVSVPVVSGVFRPVILLPDTRAADQGALRGMLRHELAHVKHQDILLQWAAQAAVALHWYNPFSFLLFRMLAQVNEQYSDAEAVHGLSDRGKRSYCEVLIHYSERAGRADRSLAVLGFSNPAKVQIRARMDEVLNKKPRRPGIAFCAGGLVLLAGITCALVYRPPLTIKGSMPATANPETLMEKGVEIYFMPGETGTFPTALFQEELED